MNSEERKMILKMLEEGKITLEEADTLIEALEADLPPGEEPARASDKEIKVEILNKIEDELKESGLSMKELKKHAGELKKSVHQGLTEAKKDFEKAKEDVGKTPLGEELSGLGGLIKSIINSASFGFGTGGHPFEKTFQGEFDQEAKLIDVTLSTRNGHIIVEPTEEDQYTIDIKGRSKGEGKEVHGLEVSQQPNRLVVKVREREVVANINLKIPRKLFYRLDLDTSNGRIEVQGLAGEEMRADTSNGRVVFKDLKARALQADTSNGRVEMLKVEAEELSAETSNGGIYMEGYGRLFRCETSNGSVTIKPAFRQDAQVTADTSNGRIRILLPADPDIGYKLEADTTMGSVNADLPDLEYSERTESYTRKKIKAHTRSWQDKPKKVELEADTSMGSILITSRKDDEEQ